MIFNKMGPHQSSCRVVPNFREHFHAVLMARFVLARSGRDEAIHPMASWIATPGCAGLVMTRQTDPQLRRVAHFSVSPGGFHASL